MHPLRHRTALAAALLLIAGSARADLLVSRSVYTGTASTVTVGQALPGGGTAIANGAYPFVFNNSTNPATGKTVDGSFGVTAPIFIDHITNAGNPVATFAVPTTLVTSFSSKSELALNLSTGGNVVTFMAYSGPGIRPNVLDVSNSNTPGITEPGNYTSPTAYRTVVQIDAFGNLQSTQTNTYPGNNGRAAILNSLTNQFILAGNAGNAKGSAQVTAATGVQLWQAGTQATPATPGTTKVAPGFSITQVNNPATGMPYAPDKTAKDSNFRGETVFNNALYVTKGSGGNGINTVYVVNVPGGGLPTIANAATTTLSVLPGFPTILASNSAGVSTGLPSPNDFVMHPFGLFFANANTLYVADEGDGVPANAGTNKDPYAGLQKWTFDGTTWHLDYVLTNGLNLGQKYGVPNGPNGEVYPASLDPATDGLRNITGVVNPDGSVTVFAVTSTVSASGDQGADPNMIVSITDLLSATSLPTGENFSVVDGPAYGQVYRGVVEVSPTFLVPEPSSLALFGLAGAALGAWRWRRRRAA